MPHHFKWINRATLLFNLASAELLGGCVGVCVCACVCACACMRGKGCVIKDAKACLSLSRADRLMDSAGRRAEGQKDGVIGREGD